MARETRSADVSLKNAPPSTSDSTDVKRNLEGDARSADQRDQNVETSACSAGSMDSASTSIVTEHICMQGSDSLSVRLVRSASSKRFKISLPEARHKAINAIKRAKRRRLQGAIEELENEP